MPTNGVTVAGTPGPIQVSEQLDRSITESPERRLHYRGERVATASAFGLVAANAAHASYRQDGASATIDVVYKDITEVVDTVEIDFNAVQREWWTCPAYSVLTNGELAAILGRLKALEDYASDPTNTPGQVDGERLLYIQQLGGLAGQAFDDILANGETYIALLPVVTFTRSVSAFFGTPFVILDMGKLFTTAQVIANVPGPFQFGIAQVTNTVAANSLQTLAWLKTGRYGRSSDGGALYIQQYIFDAYATGRYTFA